MTTWVLTGDCVESMRAMPDCSIDAVVTDPPYGLSKEPDIAEVLRHWLAGEDYEHRGGGFMGKSWDSFVPGPSVWREVLRVLKPGGHALVFSGTRTYDLTVIAMRIAGFEIRDQLAWIYGSGLPKYLDVAKAIDKAAGHWRGRAGEVVGCSVSMSGPHYARTDKGEPITDDAKRWEGWATALKPAQEPIVLARKHIARKHTVAANVIAHGTGALHIDACRIGDEERINAPAGNKPGLPTYALGGVRGMPQDAEPRCAVGRWPANVLLDEDAAAVMDEQHAGASRFFYIAKASVSEREAGLEAAGLPLVKNSDQTGRAEGSAGLNSGRSGAVGGSDGRRNHHPTVKPVSLMRHLIRLVAPPGGIVLDPFAGSGTTLVAAIREGTHAVGCELSPEYVRIIEARTAHALATPDEGA